MYFLKNKNTELPQNVNLFRPNVHFNLVFFFFFHHLVIKSNNFFYNYNLFIF